MLSPLNITVNILILLSGVWCLTPLSTMFQLYRGGQFLLLLEETGVPGENHRTTDKLYHIMLYRVHVAMSGI